MEKKHSFSLYMLTSSGETVALASMQVMVWGLLHFLVQQPLQQEMLKLMATLAFGEFTLTVLTFWILLVLEVRALLWWWQPAGIKRCDVLYSATPLKGHPWNEDTPPIRTLDQVLTSYKYVLFTPWNEDTLLIGTHYRGPRVSILEEFHCISKWS